MIILDVFYNLQTVTVPIQDVNEAPTDILLSGLMTVNAKANPGNPIGQLAAQDPDIGQLFSFSVIGQNSDVVQVSGVSRHLFYLS